MQMQRHKHSLIKRDCQRQKRKEINQRLPTAQRPFKKSGDLSKQLVFLSCGANYAGSASNLSVQELVHITCIEPPHPCRNSFYCGGLIDSFFEIEIEIDYNTVSKRAVLWTRPCGGL